MKLFLGRVSVFVDAVVVAPDSESARNELDQRAFEIVDDHFDKGCDVEVDEIRKAGQIPKYLLKDIPYGGDSNDLPDRSVEEWWDYLSAEDEARELEQKRMDSGGNLFEWAEKNNGRSGNV